MENGILYIASGSSYIDDAIRSAKSVKKNTGLPITLVADRDIDEVCFDTVIKSEDFVYHYGDSVLQIPTLPYDNTILLDTDTIVSGSISELFRLTDEFDLAASTIAEGKFAIPDRVPSSFPEFNTGVVLFNKNEATSKFIKQWKDIYKTYLDDGVRMNQPAFREALYKSSVRSTTIPTEYNCRANFGGYLTSEVKILHGNFQNPSSVLDTLNKSDTPRIFFNENNRIQVKRVNTTNNRFDI